MVPVLERAVERTFELNFFLKICGYLKNSKNNFIGSRTFTSWMALEY